MIQSGTTRIPLGLHIGCDAEQESDLYASSFDGIIGISFLPQLQRLLSSSRISASTVKEFNDKAIVKELTGENNATVVLYALWSK